MDRNRATTIFEALSSDVRLGIFRLLVRKGADGLVAGEIAEKLKLPPTNISFHLKTLMQARLLTLETEGRFQRYRANCSLMVELIAYLTAECCSEQSGMVAGGSVASRCSPSSRRAGLATRRKP